MKTIIKHIALICAVGILACGCTAEQWENDGARASGTSTIALTMLDTDNVILDRSVASLNERTITDAYVLVFKSDNTWKNGEKVAIATDMANNGQQKPVVTTRMSLAAGDKVVVVCNTGSTLATADLASAGITMSNIDTKFACPAAGWDINQFGTADSGKGMPMQGTMVWGTDTECIMTRAVAKVTMHIVSPLKQDVTGSFTTANVRWTVFNKVEKQGNITAPATGLNVPATLTFDNRTNYTLRPLAGASASPTTNTEVFYLYEFGNSTNAKTTAVANNAFNADRTCIMLLLLGKYYRLDFYDRATGKYLDIKRNYHYKIIITKVGSQGYDTEAEALANPGSNIEYQVVATDPASTMIISDGQYAIGLSNDETMIIGEDRQYEAFQMRLIDVPASVTTRTVKVSGLGLSIVSPVVADQFSGTKAIPGLSSTMTPFNIALASSFNSGTITIKVGNISRVVNIKRWDNRLRDAHPSSGSFWYDTGTLLDSGVGNDFHISSNGTTVQLLIPENIIPLNLEEVKNDPDAIPQYADRTLQGYYHRVNSTPGTTKIIVRQYAPEYVGHFGSPTLDGGNYPYERMIVERVEEWIDLTTSSSSYRANWGTQNVTYYVKQEERYRGRDITSYVGKYKNSDMKNPSTPPLIACYMKNDLNGNGIIDGNETINWYMPAQSQIIGLWVSNNSYISKFETDVFYWSSTERTGAPIYNPGAIWKVFSNGTSGGSVKLDQKSRVRCVRDVKY